MKALNQYGPFAGRFCLSLIFILSGFGKIANYSGTGGYMASHGLPLVGVVLPIAILIEVGGGLGVLLGYRTRESALALAGFVLLAGILFHNFWSFQGMEHQSQMVHFLKNFSIFGGLLVLAAHGPGEKLVLESRRKKR